MSLEKVSVGHMARDLVEVGSIVLVHMDGPSDLNSVQGAQFREGNQFLSSE